MKGKLTILNKEEILRIHESTLEVLENTGMDIGSEEARKILYEAGANISGKIVKFPKHMVENALEQVEEGLILAARVPEKTIRLSQRDHSNNTNNAFSSLTDPWQGGAIRPSTNHDLEEFCVVSDYFDCIDFYLTNVLPMDIEAPLRELQSMFTAFQHTGKHIQCSSRTSEIAMFQIEMASVLSRNNETLAQKPLFSAQVNPISSLSLDAKEADTIITLAKHGIPILPYSSPLTGTTAPATLAGTLVLGNAELLGVLTLIKSVNPKGKMVYSTDTCAPHPLTGVINYDAPEYTLFAMANSQIANYYHLPSSVAHNCPENVPAHPSQWDQCRLEIILNALIGSDISVWLGSNDSGLCASLINLIISVEIIEEIYPYIRENPMYSLGEGRSFVSDYLENNLEYGRNADIYKNHNLIYGKYDTQNQVIERVKQRISSILKTHKPPPIDKGALNEMKKIMKVAKHSLVNRGTMKKNTFDVFNKIIGESPEMQSLKDKAFRVAMSNSTIMITGETGTGKGLLAKAIHQSSKRKNEAFVEVNCGAIPENLIESELFGYTKGSFTGALKEGKKGRFILANNGTIFLDEIGEMPLHLQVKLLHVLQNRAVEPIGAEKPIPINIRIIAASNKDLESMMDLGSFRQDLYFRLGTIPLHIPPLREHPGDIPLLTAYIFKNVLQNSGKKGLTISNGLMDTLMAYSWPGNIRELENFIEYAVNVSQHDRLESTDLPKRVFRNQVNPKQKEEENYNRTYKEHLFHWEYRLFSNYLKKHGRSVKAKKELAKSLDIGIATLYRKLAQLNLSDESITSNQKYINKRNEK